MVHCANVLQSVLCKYFGKMFRQNVLVNVEASSSSCCGAGNGFPSVIGIALCFSAVTLGLQELFLPGLLPYHRVSRNYFLWIIWKHSEGLKPQNFAHFWKSEQWISGKVRLWISLCFQRHFLPRPGQLHRSRLHIAPSSST